MFDCLNRGGGWLPNQSVLQPDYSYCQVNVGMDLVPD